MRIGLPEESLDDWFMGTVLPHEAALTRFLRRVWRGDGSEIADLRQEAYVRVYEAAAKERPQQAKAFLFSTARNLIVDRVRRDQIVKIDAVMDLDAVNVLQDEALIEDEVSARAELHALQDAMNTLPPKCREVIMLRKVFGYSQKETAARMGVTQAVVEGHSHRGLRRLAEALAEVSEFASQSLARIGPRQRIKEKNDKEKGS